MKVLSQKQTPQKKCKFKKLYKRFINNKKELEYKNLISYVIYKFSGIVKNIIVNETVPIQYLALLLLFDDNQKLIFNSYTISSNQNVFYYYEKDYIIDNKNQGWSQYYNSANIASIYTKSIVSQLMSPNTINSPLASNNNLNTLATTSTSTWKQTCYIGFSFDYDTLNTFIDTAYANGVTHLILEFIILTFINDGSTDDALSFADTVYDWQALGSTNQQTLLNKIRNYGMTLMASFGGSTSFNEEFQLILSSPNYTDPNTLATDLVNWLYANNCPAIDLAITYIPTTSVYSETINLVNYIGELSSSIKNLSSSTFGYYIPVSHSPQTQYFNGLAANPTYGYIYNQIEYLYGTTLDFYNIKYYNQGNSAYDDYDSIYTKDTNYYASVSELINASSVSYLYNDIPVNKIIVGKCVSDQMTSPSDDNGYVVLYSSVSTDPSMNNYVTTTASSTDTDITDWYSNGGISVWLYRIDLDSTDSDNTQLLNYFANVKH